MSAAPRFAARAARCALGLALLGPAVASAQPPSAERAAPRLTRPPRLIEFVEAPYPESERAAARAATVVLQVEITPTGDVSGATVTGSAGEAFDRAALAAVRRFRFEPAQVDGRPSAIRILYRYEFVLRAAAPTTAVFDGTVRNRAGRTPLAGVTVELEGSGQSVTDASGRFHFADVPPGRRVITLRGERLTALRTEETLEAGQRLEATYDVALAEPAAPPGEQDDLEVVVTAPPLRRQAVSTEISADQARRVPGTQGDVLRVVENMPGVARSAVGSGQLVVWGAAPEDTRVFIDGVPVPRLYHNGGLRSVLPSDFVQSVELVPGAYGAAYGRGLGGLVAVATRPLDGTGFHGGASVDLYDAAVAVRATEGDRLRVALGARRSHLDSVLGLAQTRIGDLFPVPQYYDAQARVSYALSATESVELTGLLSADRVARTVPNADPSLATRETRDVAFTRAYARSRRQGSDGSVVSVVPYVGTTDAGLRSEFGPAATALVSSATLAGVRASWRGRIASWITLEGGLDAEVTRTALGRSGSVAAPAREGDVRVFGQAPPDQINSDRWETVFVGVAPYAELDVALFSDRVHLVAGMRADAYARSVSRRTPEQAGTPPTGLFAQDLRAEPRLALRWTPSARVAFTAAYGLNHQYPQPEDLTAAFGNPRLPVSESQHVLAGATFGLTDRLSVQVTGFYSSSDQLAVRSPLAAPLLASALVPTGAGRAYGVQVLLRQELARGFFGWLSYSLMRSERRTDDGAPWRAFDYDQTHVLTAVATYELPLGFEVGLRFRVATGFPRTDVTGAYYDARRDLYQPLFGAQNGVRIPTFVQLDARVSKRFRVASTELEAFIEVQNVTDQANAEEIVYSPDYTRRGYITSLPVLPAAGLRWTF